MSKGRLRNAAFQLCNGCPSGDRGHDQSPSDTASLAFDRHKKMARLQVAGQTAPCQRALAGAETFLATMRAPLCPGRGVGGTRLSGQVDHWCAHTARKRGAGKAPDVPLGVCEYELPVTVVGGKWALNHAAA